MSRSKIEASLARAIAVAALAGLAVGVLTVIGQKVLPDTLVGVANSAVVWALFAFVGGMLVASDALAGGVGAAVLVGAVAGYYASVPILIEGAASNARSVAIWGVTGLVAGPVMGVCGRWWRSATGRRRLVATAVVSGLFATEGLRRLVGQPPDVALGCVMVGISVAIPLARARGAYERVVALGATGLVTLLVFGVFRLIDAAFLV